MENVKLTKGSVMIRTTQGLQEVEGYKFSIEGLDLTVHKVHSNNKLWTVTENISGMKVITGSGSTRKEALDLFGVMVERYSIEKLIQIRDRNLKNIKVIAS